jgi:trimethylamine--corrinoid protein Co-methyltransferase
LAVDLISKVGPKGNFLSESHTMQFFRDQQWFPTLLDRKNYDKWKKEGETSFGDRANKKVRTLLEEHNPQPLDDAKQKEILKLIESESKTRKVKY